MFTGCLVADPPLHEAPEKTPPILDLARAIPLVTQVQRVSTTDVVPELHFSVPVRSEDQGDQLLALFFLNFGEASQSPQLPITRVASGSFEDESRSIEKSWNYAGMSQGCHQLTLMVTHESNFDLVTFEAVDKSDLAIASWWVGVNDEPTGSVSLHDCPSQGGGS